MKVLSKYISHFWYVATKWDIAKAFFMLFDNIRGSIKYGAGTFIPLELNELTVIDGDKKKGSRYEPVSFYILEKLFTAFGKISDKTSIVDLGCGKGRMMMMAPHFGFTNITGIDFAKEVCEQAIRNMKQKQKQFPGITWNVINQNAEDYNIQPTDCVFYLFNPFDETVLKKILDNVNYSCNLFPRTIYFLYVTPQHEKLLLDNGYAIIYQKEKMQVRSIIAVRDVL